MTARKRRDMHLKLIQEVKRKGMGSLKLKNSIHQIIEVDETIKLEENRKTVFGSIKNRFQSFIKPQS